jgi:5-formyltetrahydrofolate cyclo-ligase
MIHNLVDDRNRIRRQFLAQRDALPLAERATWSERIIQSLVSLPIFQVKHFFFIYCHFRSEVETTILINSCWAQEKTVSVPLSQPEHSQMLAIILTETGHDLAPGYKGIPEPLPPWEPDRFMPPTSIDVAIIPGAVFDRCGHRLGYGGGFYDRFLAQAAPQAIRIGLAFSCQVVDQLPSLAHDVPMDLVITEQEVLTWSRVSCATNSRL